MESLAILLGFYAHLGFVLSRTLSQTSSNQKCVLGKRLWHLRCGAGTRVAPRCQCRKARGLFITTTLCGGVLPSFLRSGFRQLVRLGPDCNHTQQPHATPSKHTAPASSPKLASCSHAHWPYLACWRRAWAAPAWRSTRAVSAQRAPTLQATHSTNQSEQTRSTTRLPGHGLGVCKLDPGEESSSERTVHIVEGGTRVLFVLELDEAETLGRL
jgi:hypothetical protein